MTDFMDNLQLDDYMRYALALVFVLALIGLLAALARRLGMGGATPRRRGRDRRLAVSEALSLDGKRKLMLVRRDGVEHLVIVGPSSETVVEAGIAAPEVDFAARARSAARSDEAGRAPHSAESTLAARPADSTAAARSAAGRELPDRTGHRAPSPAERIGLQRPRSDAGRDPEVPA